MYLLDSRLGAPKQMPTLPNSTLKDMWDPPALKNDSNWPRLFSVSDPMSEMGLVVAHPSRPEGRGHRRSSTKIMALDTAEEILHVTRPSEFSSHGSQEPLVLALTLNRETSMYTVWKLAYASPEPVGRDKQRATSGAASRRRSSFVPVLPLEPLRRFSRANKPSRVSRWPAPIVGGKKGSRQDDSVDHVADLVSAFEPGFEDPAIPRRKSRR